MSTDAERREATDQWTVQIRDQQLRDLRTQLAAVATERDAAVTRAEKAELELTNAWPRSVVMQLTQDVDDILLGLKPTEIPGAINWGDLGAKEVQIVWTQDYTWHFRVIIEEADPVNPVLHDAVLTGLTVRNWMGVEIETAW